MPVWPALSAFGNETVETSGSRTRKEISPGTGLHDIHMNGHPVGMFLSRIGRSEGKRQGDTAVFIFAHDGGSELSLQGCAIPEGDHYRTIRLPAAGDWARALERPQQNSSEESVVVAASNR